MDDSVTVSRTVRLHFPRLNADQRLNSLCERCFKTDTTGTIPKLVPLTGPHLGRNPIFEIVDERSADIWIDPHIFNNASAAALADEAKRLDKPLLFIHGEDSVTPTNVGWGTVYRASAYRSSLRESEKILPGFCDDPVDTLPFNTRKKQATPKVSFCGFVGRWWMLALYGVLGKQEKSIGLKLRRQALAILKQDRRIETDFILREQFWGGAINLQSLRFKRLLSHFLTGEGKASEKISLTCNQSHFNHQLKQRVYSEFLSSVQESDYVLAPRGAGNFSFRFFQVLASGRIPVLIDTDVELPFSSQINWSRHIVIVPEKRVAKIADHILDFHGALNRQTFEEVQVNNRELWKSYLSPRGFLNRIIEHNDDSDSSVRRRAPNAEKECGAT